MVFATASTLAALAAAWWPSSTVQHFHIISSMGQGQSGVKSEPVSWPPANNTLPLATFAAGCFWGTELKFQRLPGVEATCVGYTGGSRQNPTYNAVCSGSTGHAEAVQLTYDPKTVSYETLCESFFKGHDATTKNRQGGDVGTQYRSAIFYHSDEQKKIAEAATGKVSGATTEIASAGIFYPAESYHQQYLEKGGRNGRSQSAAKECKDPIRCYG